MTLPLLIWLPYAEPLPNPNLRKVSFTPRKRLSVVLRTSLCLGETIAVMESLELSSLRNYGDLEPTLSYFPRFSMFRRLISESW